MNHKNIFENGRKPRKLINVKYSKYEAKDAVHSDRTYWKEVFTKMESPCCTEQLNTFENLSDVLPKDLHTKVCNILNISIDTKASDDSSETKRKRSRTLLKEPLLSYRKTIVVKRELDSDTDVELSSGEDENDMPNIYQEFLRKPEREQVTWATRYLKPEREDEKSLVRKANDLTDRIANDFCDYMRELGGNQQSQLFTPKAVKELFDVEFDTHVARGLKIDPQELFTIEDKIAHVTESPEKSKYEALEREITKDIKAEHSSNYVKAFGRSLPRKNQWWAPQNDTKKMWRSARYVPKDLVTLKTVWEGITNLRSVKEYCRWMIDHPECRRASYLTSLGMFDQAVLDARLTFETQPELLSPTLSSSPTKQNVPTPIDQIRRKLSQLTDIN